MLGVKLNSSVNPTRHQASTSRLRPASKSETAKRAAITTPQKDSLFDCPSPTIRQNLLSTMNHKTSNDCSFLRRRPLHQRTHTRILPTHRASPLHLSSIADSPCKISAARTFTSYAAPLHAANPLSPWEAFVFPVNLRLSCRGFVSWDAFPAVRAHTSSNDGVGGGGGGGSGLYRFRPWSPRRILRRTYIRR